MKKLILLAFPTALLLCVLACTKRENTDFQLLDDPSLASEIATYSDKQTLKPQDLPAGVIQTINTEFFDTYVESVALAADRGYEVTLGTEDQVYFNLEGRRLRHELRRLLGICGPLGGIMIPVDSLRPAIVEYVHEHYPDAQILRAKRRGDRIIVLLSGHTILVFSPNGVFEVNDAMWFDCRCKDADQVNLPQAVLDLVETQYPGADVKKVCRRGDRIIVGALTADGRKIFVFDGDWNFLFVH